MAKNSKSANPTLAGGAVGPSNIGKTKEDWIGSQLKRIYDEALTEDIPEDMLSLLDQLDNKTQSGDQAGEESTQ